MSEMRSRAEMAEKKVAEQSNRITELEAKLEVACDCAGCGTNDQSPECDECIIIKALKK
jgi:hypothetical protein